MEPAARLHGTNGVLVRTVNYTRAYENEGRHDEVDSRARTQEPAAPAGRVEERTSIDGARGESAQGVLARSPAARGSESRARSVDRARSGRNGARPRRVSQGARTRRERATWFDAVPNRLMNVDGRPARVRA